MHFVQMYIRRSYLVENALVRPFHGRIKIMGNLLYVQESLRLCIIGKAWYNEGLDTCFSVLNNVIDFVVLQVERQLV